MQVEPRLGANYLGNGLTSFRVWAPNAQKVELRLQLQPEAPQKLLIERSPEGNGYFYSVLDGVFPGARYAFKLDQAKERPDPASRYQADGVHGPSEVIDQSFPWKDSTWKGHALEKYVIYELHVG